MKSNPKKNGLANRRGVFQPFNYQATGRLAAILVGREVGKTSEALRKAIKGEDWQKDVYDQPVRVEGLFYNPFQLRGHAWTTIIGLLRSEEPPFSYPLAQELSAALKAKAIFFCYEKTSSTVLLILFEKGKVAEALVNCGAKDLKILGRAEISKREKAGWPEGFYFYSGSRKLKRDELNQKSFKAFVDEFFRRQDAWLSFDGAASVADGCATFGLEDGDRDDVLRADLVSVKAARILTKGQIRDEQAANKEAENSNYCFAMATTKVSELPRSLRKSLKIWMGMHEASIKKLKRLLKGPVRVEGYWLWQAAKCGNGELAAILIEAGSDLNACPHGSTALEAAIRNGHVDIAVALLKAGSNPNKQGKWSGPPILVATAKGQVEVVQAMIAAGVDVNVKGDVSCGDNDESPRAEDATALIVAVRSGCPELVEVLLKGKADTSLTDKGSKTAMQWAEELKEEKTIGLLRGEDLNGMPL